MTDRPARLPLLSIALLSATALATELYLVRLFAIIQWHHAAYMIISLALLGYGVSGTVLALARQRLLARFDAVYPVTIALFGLLLPACLWLAQRLDFNAERLLWQTEDWWLLASVYLLLALPFLFAAAAIGLALDAGRDRVTRLYGADLTGAGLGALAMVVMLNALPIASIPAALTSLALLAAAIALLERRCWRHLYGVILLTLATLPWLLPAGLMQPKISEYKPLQQALRVKGTQAVESVSGPQGMLTVIESPQVPFRQAPGLSLLTPAIPGEQLGLSQDGGDIAAMTRVGPDTALDWLDWMPSALPYQLSEPKRILIAGTDGGMAILQALRLSAAEIDVVEPDPHRITLISKTYADWTRLAAPATGRLHYHVADIREFLHRTAQHYDLIVFGSAANGGNAGLGALKTQNRHTVQAYREYLEHLTPHGRLALSSWLQLPPRGIPKQIATAAQALRGLDTQQPGEHVLLIRSLQTATLLIGRKTSSAADIETLRAFSDERSFDIAWYHGMPESLANRHNRLQQPWLYRASRQLLGDSADAFFDDYAFDVRPATDDRPYFSHFFRWRLLQEIIDNRGRGGMALMEGGYLVLLVTLLQAIIAGAVLILLPLALSHRTGGWRKDHLPAHAGYFTGLGLAFLFLEIAFIERLTLILGHPLHAVAVALSGFLIFSGIGSTWAGRLAARLGVRRLLWASITMIIIAAIIHLLAGDLLTQGLRGLPVFVKIPLVLATLAPLAIPMGMPFPLGIGWLARSRPDFIPWAWGLNGFASVVSAVLATLLALHLGFSAVVLIAAGLYLACAMLMSIATKAGDPINTAQPG